VVRVHRPAGLGQDDSLTNSGLNFPLAAQMGKNAVRGAADAKLRLVVHG